VAAAAAPAKPAAPKPAAAAPAPPPVPAGERSQTRVKMTPIRKRTAERLVAAQQTGALLTTFNEIDMFELMDLRKQYKEVFEKQFGAKLGFMSAFVYACSKALQVRIFLYLIINI
jgi:2-oxoglutarate dehydrogenase E2 component (dihydrolipoamide succinyltransferase)